MFGLRKRVKPIPTPPSRQPYYLMQRISTNDGYEHMLGEEFSLEPMGANEFERGGAAESLQRLRSRREALRIQVVTQELNGVNRPLYFVGDINTLAHDVDVFVAWFSAQKEDSKRYSRLREAYAVGSDPFGTVAWWALKADVVIALDSDVAQRLLTIFSLQNKE